MIQTKELIYEYEKRDEEGNIIGMKRAIDGVDIDIPEGSLWQSWDTTVPESRRWQSI